MKKIVLSLFLLFVVFSVFNLLAPNAISNPTGAPAGNTGSPSDATTCAESCHGGSAVTQAGLITSNIPTAGYTPGSTYTITASISGSGNKGFQVVETVSAENVGSTICDGPAKIVRSNNRVLLDMEFQVDVCEGGNEAEYIWQRQVCLGRHWQL